MQSGSKPVRAAVNQVSLVVAHGNEICDNRGNCTTFSLPSNVSVITIAKPGHVLYSTDVTPLFSLVKEEPFAALQVLASAGNAGNQARARFQNMHNGRRFTNLQLTLYKGKNNQCPDLYLSTRVRYTHDSPFGQYVKETDHDKLNASDSRPDVDPDRFKNGSNMPLLFMTRRENDSPEYIPRSSTIAHSSSFTKYFEAMKDKALRTVQVNSGLFPGVPLDLFNTVAPEKSELVFKLVSNRYPQITEDAMLSQDEAAKKITDINPTIVYVKEPHKLSHAIVSRKANKSKPLREADKLREKYSGPRITRSQFAERSALVHGRQQRQREEYITTIRNRELNNQRQHMTNELTAMLTFDYQQLLPSRVDDELMREFYDTEVLLSKVVEYISKHLAENEHACLIVACCRAPEIHVDPIDFVQAQRINVEYRLQPRS